MGAMTTETATPDAERILEEVTLPRAVVFVQADGDGVLRVEDLLLQAAGAQQADRDDAEALIEQVAAAMAKLDGTLLRFELVALPSTTWKDLKKAHPPSPAQRRGGLDHDPDTFWPEALAEMLVAPAFTVEQVGRLGQRLSEGQWQRLVGTALQLNLGGAK